MTPFANLPVFVNLKGARVVLAGEGEAAAWKAELLVAAGAALEVFAPAPTARLAQAARCTPRVWRDDDLAGARVAVLETGDDGEAARFLAAGRRAGALVNVIDRPAFCDFSFGAVIARASLVIGVSTDGAAPTLAQAARARIEAILPETLGAWAEAARGWRARLAGLEAARRRAIWRAFAAQALAADRPPTEADFAALSQAERAGRLVVVGAGCGGADMATLRAVRALQAADHIVEDGPVVAGVRDLGRREASYARFPEGAGPEARADVAGRVAAGATVVVLVPGDGRASGWAEAEIVQGVSAP